MDEYSGQLLKDAAKFMNTSKFTIVSLIVHFAICSFVFITTFCKWVFIVGFILHYLFMMGFSIRSVIKSEPYISEQDEDKKKKIKYATNISTCLFLFYVSSFLFFGMLILSNYVFV